MKEQVKRLNQYYVNDNYVVVIFTSQSIFVFLLFWGGVMWANEIEKRKNIN